MSWGIVARFHGPGELLAAAAAARDAGYRRLDAYAPFPVHGLTEAVGVPHTRLPWFVFGAGCLGGALAFGMQVWMNAFDYPLNVGGRPLISWPSFIVPTFEVIILAAALTTVLGMFFANGLPEPYHPLFDAPGFTDASTDAFFLSIETNDPLYHPERTRAFLEELHGEDIAVV
jgi:hypothetical protein